MLHDHRQRHPACRRGSLPRRLGLLRRFRREEGGALAVEFGLIAPIFLGLLFGIIEIALMFWTTQVLETAVGNAARQIYTGTFQESSGNNPSGAGYNSATALSNFKATVCSNVTALFNCNNLVSVDVQRVSGSTWSAPSSPVTNGVYDPSTFGYNPPGNDEICVVRAAMEYPVYVNLLGYATGLRNGKRLIMASAAFKTEPYK